MLADTNRCLTCTDSTRQSIAHQCPALVRRTEVRPTPAAARTQSSYEQPFCLPLWGLSGGAAAPLLRRAGILMVSTSARTSKHWCLLPRRAHALDGAGQQATARRHRGLLPAVSVRLVLVAQASTHSCTPQQALCAAVRATHPVRSTHEINRYRNCLGGYRTHKNIAGTSHTPAGEKHRAGGWS